MSMDKGNAGTVRMCENKKESKPQKFLKSLARLKNAVDELEKFVIKVEDGFVANIANEESQELLEDKPLSLADLLQEAPEQILDQANVISLLMSRLEQALFGGT